jgi:hypothetical protein
MRITQAITGVALSIILASCTLEVPKPTTVQVTIYKNGKPEPSANTLSQSQQNKLAGWLEKYNSGWSKSYASYVPVIEVRITHADRSVSVLNVRNTNHVIAYGNFGQYEQEFNSTAMSELRQTIGIK